MSSSRMFVDRNLFKNLVLVATALLRFVFFMEGDGVGWRWNQNIIKDDICLQLYLFLFYFMATPIELIFEGVSKSNTYILIDITHDCLPYYKW